jgi:hypothetical protein
MAFDWSKTKLSQIQYRNFEKHPLYVKYREAFEVLRQVMDRKGEKGHEHVFVALDLCEEQGLDAALAWMIEVTGLTHEEYANATQLLWSTKDGRLLLLWHMETTHLENILGMMERSYWTWREEWEYPVRAELRKRRQEEGKNESRTKRK